MMRIIYIVKAIIIFFCLMGCQYKKQEEKQEKKEELLYVAYTQEALEYVKEKGLSTDFYILVDFSIHSGKKRMFLIDLFSNQVIYSSMVTHGIGNSSSDQKVVFSNVPNSYCSSQGKYILGSKKVYSPGYRHKYIMYGQESTNSNAVVRDVVFHPWNIVPTHETYPNGIPMSWGCPAVSEEAFYHIDMLIQQAQGRVLLWII